MITLFTILNSQAVCPKIFVLEHSKNCTDLKTWKTYSRNNLGLEFWDTLDKMIPEKFYKQNSSEITQKSYELFMSI